MILSLALAAFAAPAAQDPSAEVPPRRPVANLHGYQLDSRVVFAVTGIEQHARLTCVFPARGRLWMRDAAGERFVLYRLGPRAYGLPSRTTTSAEYEGEAAVQTVRHFELRGAVALFPHGHAWRGDGARRTADLGVAGRLVATLAADGRPTRIEARDAEDRPVEAYGALTWREVGGRAWPATATFERGGRPVWTETFGAVETAVRVIDDFFLPPDRRGEGVRSDLTEAGAIDLEPRVERAVPLRAESVSKALDRAAAARARAAAELEESGRALAEGTVLELDERARPRALLLRLEGTEGPVPEGWSRTAEGSGIQVRLPRSGDLGAGLRERLLRAGPPEARAGRWYVRLDARDPRDGPCQVVLTLLPAED